MINCVCCGSEDVTLIGAIPSTTNFAGRKLDVPLQGGDLLRCRICRLAFRYPRISKLELDELYRLGDADNWQLQPSMRSDWEIARQWITRFIQHDGTILDVGCFDGEFLRFMGSKYNRFGIEIHEDASEKARASGIHLVGNDFSVLKETKAKFGVVTSFDVIEHTHDPMDFLSKLAGVTCQNGFVIISTGNSDALSWRFVGSRYWYCVIGEHLSFINPSWCAWAAPRAGLELKQVVTFSHVDSTWQKRIVDVAKNLFFALAPRTFVWLRKVGLYRGSQDLLNEPPYWGTAKDHCIYLLVKK